MNAYSRTMPLPGALRPVRERGSSALDRRATTWPAPDPSARVGQPWGAPIGRAVAHVGLAPWPAPDPIMRFDLLVPVALAAPSTDLVEPVHPFPVPDLTAVARAAFAPPLPAPVTARVTTARVTAPGIGVESIRPGLPAPTLGDAAIRPAPAPDRSGISARLVIGLAAAAAALAVGAAAIISLL